ncbi:hypothetical protein NHB13_10165 [Delftia tsuruhatensis]|uniref:hypothetical protein n=1 Tax=Delftia tsuruhatensis TaxID=180282 RepID=UPI0020919821|nr:hypothetical protein [Delftia tsuruhatensis]MCO5336967.1 hypothetical protein [Delftia tsuruhatensis]
MLHNKENLDNGSRDSLRETMQAFFRKPSSVGEAVATAFILENVELFRQFLSKHPKVYEVSAHRWLEASIASIEKSKLHSEAADEFQIEVGKIEANNFDDWGDSLKAQEDKTKELYFGWSPLGRSL